jgi:hypothetical protein
MISYISEDEHLERMAQSIYLASFRRDAALVRGWKTLPENARVAFRELAAQAIIGADKIRDTVFQTSRDLPAVRKVVA